MALRPWVTPEEVKAYTDYKDVAERSDKKLETDIMRAEQYVIHFTNNPFASSEYESIPESVKTAVTIVANSIAHNAVEETKSLKSETYDDYSYTTESTTVKIESLDLMPLLSDYVIVKERNRFKMRMRKL